jgi:hypothetical protein
VATFFDFDARVMREIIKKTIETLTMIISISLNLRFVMCYALTMF